MQSSGESDSKGQSVVVVGVDFSEPSQRALAVACSIATTAPKPELHLVHVLPTLQTLGLGATAMAADGLTLEPVRQARALLEQAANDAKGGARRVVAHLRFGNPATEVAQLAVDLNADLVVVGTHGRTGLDRLLLGSTAEAVLRRAPCTVLTVRAKPAQASVEIEPPCPDCLAVRTQTKGATSWCPRHSEHHARAHLHYEVPDSYGLGWQSFATFRSSS